jgi:DNA-binding transcriptional ArsR family regulator
VVDRDLPSPEKHSTKWLTRGLHMLLFNHMVESPRQSLPQLNMVFHALSDPTRRAILRDIADGEKTVGEIARPYPSSLAAVSKHIYVLEGSGLVTRRKQGSFQFVQINAAPLKEAQQWLSYYEQFWNEHLDQFQQHFKSKRKDR